MLRERMYKKDGVIEDIYDFATVRIVDDKAKVVKINRSRFNEALLELPEELWDSAINLYKFFQI